MCHADSPFTHLSYSIPETWLAAVTAAREPRRVSIDARLAFGVAFVHVIKAMAEAKRAGLFNEIATESLVRLEQTSAHPMEVEDTGKGAAVLSIVADEIRVLSGLVSAFADETYQEVYEMQSGTRTSPERRRYDSVPAYVLSAVRRALPSILHCATHLIGDEVSHTWLHQSSVHRVFTATKASSSLYQSISFALKTFCSDLVPLSVTSNDHNL